MVFRNSPKIKLNFEFGQSHLTENLKTKPTKKDSCHLDYYFKSYGILKLAQNSVFKIIFIPQKKGCGSTAVKPTGGARGPTRQ